MPVVLTCPQGHQWQAESGDAAPGVPRTDACPVCGAISRTLAGSESPATPPSDPETLPPVPSPVNADAATELCQFLAPAQEPDELGRLGNYRVLAILGYGGMGVVYKAEDVQLGRLVALKAMLPGLAASAANRQRFLREAQAAAALEHDHIVTVYQVGEDRNIPYLAMPLLKGESLNDRLQREPILSVAEVLRIGRETAGGLAAAHERGLIHRDVKPANLWLETNGGRVKVLDFGLARAATESAHLTATGAILGTPAYMAPEQASGKPVDGRTDLFALGCVLYRMSTGELPFKGNDAISTLMAVAMEQPPPPSQLNPTLPPGLSALVLQLLAKNPADRPASAPEVVRMLAALERAPAVAHEELPIVDVVPVVRSEAGVRPDNTEAILDALPIAPQKAQLSRIMALKREREAALNWTGAIFGAMGLGTLGVLIGAIVGAFSGPSVGLVNGASAGFIFGGILGLFAGPLVAGVYDGYLTAEHERRKREKHR